MCPGSHSDFTGELVWPRPAPALRSHLPRGLHIAALVFPSVLLISYRELRQPWGGNHKDDHITLTGN